MIDLQSNDIGEISHALMQFQKDCPVLEFDGEAALKGTSKAGKDYEYKYKYLTFPKLRSDTKEHLAANNLAIFQTTCSIDGQFNVVTTLSHTSGQWIRGFYPVVADMKDPQKVGSAMSYAKRYAMSAILGVVAEADDDGNYGNQSRQERQEAAEQKQRQIEARLKEEKKKEATYKLAAIEMVLENCTTLEELQANYTGRCAKDIAWLRGNSPDDYRALVMKKDEIKEKLNG